MMSPPPGLDHHQTHLPHLVTLSVSLLLQQPKQRRDEASSRDTRKPSLSRILFYARNETITLMTKEEERAARTRIARSFLGRETEKKKVLSVRFPSFSPLSSVSGYRPGSSRTVSRFYRRVVYITCAYSGKGSSFLSIVYSVAKLAPPRVFSRSLGNNSGEKTRHHSEGIYLAAVNTDWPFLFIFSRAYSSLTFPCIAKERRVRYYRRIDRAVSTGD